MPGTMESLQSRQQGKLTTGVQEQPGQHTYTLSQK